MVTLNHILWGVYSTHSQVSHTAQVNVQLYMRTSFPFTHSLFTRFSKRRKKGGQQVPLALYSTHLSKSKCNSPIPPNASISQQRSRECIIMLQMPNHRIDRPNSRSFSMHSLYISNTQGRTLWEGSSLASIRLIIPLASCIPILFDYHSGM
ncbi:185, putative [Theobroma cacao]|uniref:185, putative n=1 Tax=Theobroma cacao TaxID=3641 RepID=A0A061FQS6_THECC|nr:185, putative [Theobroma cacao]